MWCSHIRRKKELSKVVDFLYIYIFRSGCHGSELGCAVFLFFIIIIFVQRFPGSHKTGESEWATPSWSAWEGQKEERMKRRKRVRKKKKNCSRGMQSERWFSHGCMYRRRVHKKLLVKSLCAQVCERKNSVNYGHCCFHQVYFLISFQLKY